MNVVASKNVGRPRDDAREAAILDATLAVLQDVGYDRLTIDAVAAKAQASKATVYRRWPNKAALVVDAMSRIKPTAQAGAEEACLFPDTGSLRGDLITGLRQLADKLSTDEGRLMCGVMTAQARDPELAAAMREGTEDKRRSCQTLVDRAIARGELDSTRGVTAFVEVVPAVMYHRLLIAGEPFDEQFISHVADDIALPLLGRPGVTP
ncbi:MAG TPA: TetR/AcrR family transcriptional regulator [Mycobacteriales bacterium]|nr:TetR/AcrR family transcriptional regulator [Mycobacteriales bacterium]